MQAAVDPPTLTMLFSGATLLVSLWTRAAVAESETKIMDRVQEKYVSKDLCTQKHLEAE